ncbi:Uncharacterised protein [uncultured Clostridium sp.]|nr:Uncharacterised protein [uncultured Clostridium sp.]
MLRNGLKCGILFLIVRMNATSGTRGGIEYG